MLDGELLWVDKYSLGLRIDDGVVPYEIMLNKHSIQSLQLATPESERVTRGDTTK